MSRPPPRITCLFHSDLSVVSFLNSAEGRPWCGDVVIECSPRPALAFPLNVETPANYPGVCGLLGGVDVGLLAHATDRVPAPVIFAPGSAVAATAVRAALARLGRPDERLTAVTLLVPIAFARELGAALAIADKFGIAWDATAFPHDELADFARWVSAEKFFTAANFGGLFPYAAEGLAPAHRARLETLLDPLTARAPAIRPLSITER
jgi:hypothetical protein